VIAGIIGKMIEQIHIEEFAVIDRLDLELGPSLNILTGETGAGKSVIVDAINMTLGERADADMIRSGSDRAIVEVVFDLSRSSKAVDVLRMAGFEPEDGRVILSREIHSNGRSQCRVNGRPAALSLVKEVTDHLVDIHGQHDHQSLLRPDSHIDLLDEWCGADALLLRARIAQGYARLRELKGELRQLEADERERARNIDLYRFQIDEIERASLSPGEEDRLELEFARLANAEKMQESVSRAYQALGDRSNEMCALDRVAEAADAIRQAASIDPALNNLLASVDSVIYQLEDVSRDLRNYRDAVEVNPEKLRVVQERLEEIKALKRKYGETEQAVLDYAQSLRDRLALLLSGEERSAELSAEISKTESDILLEAQNLSKLRLNGGRAFADAVVRELAELGIPNCSFEVFQEPKDLDATGIDRIEFLISTNPGEPAKPLSKIASGGEISRVMLAVKSLVANFDNIPTLIFDEIDVGVGGRTAEVIARKLELLSTKCQVLCVTHLPQIASRPATHFGIEKQVRNGRSVVRVKRLKDEDRVNEIARMLGGANPSLIAVKHAREMLGMS